MTKILAAALDYSKKGWAVFPVKPSGKTPACKHGHLEATTNADTIRQWWEENPEANIGLACGKSGLIAIDLDAKNGGLEAWHNLKKKHGIDDDTIINLTGGGGQHLIFIAPNGTKIRNSASKLGSGVDIRADGGYIVVPPSVHPNGTLYDWEVGAHPDDREPAPLPEALLKLLTVKDKGNGKNGRAEPLAKKLRKGKRNHNLTSAAGTMRQRGMSEDAILAALLVENEQKCSPPLEVSEVEKIAKSVARYAPDEKEERKKRLVSADYAALFKEWGYKVRLNEMSDDVEVNGTPITDLVRDTICTRIRDCGIQENYGVSVAHAMETLSAVSRKNAYHPIKQYLESLAWDGNDTIGELCNYFTDKEGVFSRWFRHWIVGAVGKIYENFQNPMLVLDSQKQGVGKSYFANWLCPLKQFFNASSIAPENKDHKLRLFRVWLWEVEEMGTTTRKADVEALKAFISLEVVRERKAYGHFDTVKPAVASFIGTCNDQGGFLVDRSGNRRFLVCTLVDIDWAYDDVLDVNQLWAQAKHIYDTSNEWHLTADDVRRRDALNVEYLVDDPIETALESLLSYTGDPLDEVSNIEIDDKLQVYGFKLNRATSMTVAGVLKSWGCDKWRRGTSKRKERGYSGIKWRQF